MATSDGFFEFIKEQLSGTEDITFRKMMGIFTLKDDESGASADQKIDYINTYGLRK